MQKKSSFFEKTIDNLELLWYNIFAVLKTAGGSNSIMRFSAPAEERDLIYEICSPFLSFCRGDFVF